VLPDHIESTIGSIAELHRRHNERASQHQRMINRVTAFAARPWIASILVVLVVGWIVGNEFAPHFGLIPVDPAPFSWLQLVSSLASLLIVVLVLGSQRHDDELSQHRELLSLELAILNEQKSAKIIHLLEEERRDNPLLNNRVDSEAELMAQSADPHVVLDALKEKAILNPGGAPPLSEGARD